MKYGVKFLSPARFDRDPFGRLRFHPLEIHVRYRDYYRRAADALEEVVNMFGCKSRSRALQVVTKYIQPGTSLDELRGISTTGFGEFVEHKVAIRSMVDYAKSVGLDVSKHYDGRSAYDYDELRRDLSGALLDWRYFLIYDQRKKRDEIIAYRKRMADLKKKMRAIPESAETSRRQLRALGIVA